MDEDFVQDITSFHLVTKDIFDLRHSDNDSCSTGKATDNGMTKEDGDKTETAQARREIRCV